MYKEWVYEVFWFIVLPIMCGLAMLAMSKITGIIVFSTYVIALFLRDKNRKRDQEANLSSYDRALAHQYQKVKSCERLLELIDSSSIRQGLCALAIRQSSQKGLRLGGFYMALKISAKLHPGQFSGDESLEDFLPGGRHNK